MAEKTPSLFTPPSPGETLRRYIVDGERITQDELAAAMGVSRLTVNQLINGKRSVTAETALKLARVLRTTPEFWLDLQRSVDMHEAKESLGRSLERMPVLRRAR
ncbi:MAG: HigA family addiction module antidote protein [Proteobacteria bacterium]|nr:HigA family addiction module antidote protein [Pseudomonadota bacterium]